MPKRLTFQQRLDRFPPILIRLLVTRGGKHDRTLPTAQPRWVPTDRELADSCGLTMAEFKFVSYSTRWDGPVMAYLARYLRGCDVDLESRRCFLRLQWMRDHGTFTHLRASPLYDFQFAEMLEIWEQSELT